MDRNSGYDRRQIRIPMAVGVCLFLEGCIGIVCTCIFLISGDSLHFGWNILLGGFACGVGMFTIFASRVQMPAVVSKDTVIVETAKGFQMFMGAFSLLFMLLAGFMFAAGSVRDDFQGYILSGVMAVFSVAACSYLILFSYNIKMIIKRDGQCLAIGLTGRKKFFYLRDIKSIRYKQSKVEERIVLLDRNGKKITEVHNFLENSQRLISILMDEYGLELEYDQPIFMRNKYVETKEGKVTWDARKNTWQNKNVLGIYRGFKVMSIVLLAACGCVYLAGPSVLSLKSRLLIWSGAALCIYGYCLVFNQGLYWGDSKSFAHKSWEESHRSTGVWLLFIMGLLVGMVFFKTWLAARVIDVWKFAGLCIIFTLLLTGIGIFRMPKHMRMVDSIFLLFIVSVLMSYFFTYTTAYSLCGQPKLQQVRNLGQKLKYNKESGNKRYYITFEFQDGKIYKKNVEPEMYRDVYGEEYLQMYVYDSPLNIRFVDFTEYKKE